MKKSVFTGLSTLAVTALVAGIALAQSNDVRTLRGADVDQAIPVDDMHKQIKGRMARNYRQQPPLVPHSIDQYQMDLRTNQCLSCHDWTVAGERGAPTLSMTHYLDRAGNQLDKVAGTRWFCNQCHVPQANAPALVDNTFQPSNASK